MEDKTIPYNTTRQEEASQQSDIDQPEKEPLTRKETLHIMRGAMMAAYAVAAVMILSLLLFLLFCQFIWLH